VALYEKNGKTARNFYASPATFGAQGTSSMDYALKNLRIYFGKKIKDVDYATQQYENLKTSKMWLGVPEGFVPT
jgi:hypothetical protein